MGEGVRGEGGSDERTRIRVCSERNDVDVENGARVVSGSDAKRAASGGE